MNLFAVSQLSVPHILCYRPGPLFSVVEYGIWSYAVRTAICKVVGSQHEQCVYYRPSHAKSFGKRHWPCQYTQLLEIRTILF